MTILVTIMFNTENSSCNFKEHNFFFSNCSYPKPKTFGAFTLESVDKATWYINLYAVTTVHTNVFFS